MKFSQGCLLAPSAIFAGYITAPNATANAIAIAISLAVLALAVELARSSVSSSPVAEDVVSVPPVELDEVLDDVVSVPPDEPDEVLDDELSPLLSLVPLAIVSLSLFDGLALVDGLSERLVVSAAPLAVVSPLAIVDGLSETLVVPAASLAVVLSPPDEAGHVLAAVPPVPQVSELHASDEHGVLHARLPQAHASALRGRPDVNERLLIVGTAAE